jgi:erythritol transport system ATP-binding protein
MMDEPTSALSAAEISILFRVIRGLTGRGAAVLYISHRLEELLGIADSVSVLRDGRMVAEAETAAVDAAWIVERMTGRPEVRDEREAREYGPEALRAEGVSLASGVGRAALRDVSLRLRAGEVVGVYGLMGAGRTELLECLMGMHPYAAGSIFLDSTNLRGLGAAARLAKGLAMAPEDRQAAGLVQSLSVLANMTLASIGRISCGPWLTPALELRAAGGLAEDLRIKAPGLRCNIGALSGGNQQKVVIAKCLLTKPRVLLLDEPTRGVDVGAKREIHMLVRRLAKSGMGVVLASSEPDELRATADRVVVLSRGTVAAEFSAAAASDEALAAAAERVCAAGGVTQ